MILRSSLINHLKARTQLEGFVRDSGERLCVVQGPSNFGKTTLSEWFHDRFREERPTIHLQLHETREPREIIDTILKELKIEPLACERLQQCRLPFVPSHASNQGITISSSQNVSLVATAAPRDGLALNYYYSELFDAFVADISEYTNLPPFIVVVDNFERGDKVTQEWAYAKLLTLCSLLDNIKIVLFCRELQQEKLSHDVRRSTLHFRLREIEDIEELFQWIRDRGREIDTTTRRLVENALEMHRDNPVFLTMIIKTLCR